MQLVIVYDRKINCGNANNEVKENRHMHLKSSLGEKRKSKFWIIRLILLSESVKSLQEQNEQENKRILRWQTEVMWNVFENSMCKHNSSIYS